MEIQVIKSNGCKMYVFFTGDKYVLYSEYYGTMAIAERSDLAQEKGHEFFTITVGNHHCKGGTFTDSTVFGIMKKSVTKSENRYIPKKVSFERAADVDLANVRTTVVAG